MCCTLGNAWLSSRAYPSLRGFNSASDAPCACLRCPRSTGCAAHLLSGYSPVYPSHNCLLQFAPGPRGCVLLMARGCGRCCLGGLCHWVSGWGLRDGAGSCLVGGVCCGTRTGTSAEHFGLLHLASLPLITVTVMLTGYQSPPHTEFYRITEL